MAYGLAWQPGDNAVISNLEFPSNRIVWESLDKYGVDTRIAEITDVDAAEDAIIGQIDTRTRLVSVSSVQYGTGLRLDIARLGAACRERGVLFCVDAIQSLGAVRFDVQAIHGSGSNPAILRAAGIEKAGFVAAVTDSDEVNLAAASVVFRQVKRGERMLS